MTEQQYLGVEMKSSKN